MKIFIQHKATGRFLADEGVWADDEGGAKDFPDTGSASSYCRDRGLKDVQITLRFDTGIPDITLPVQ